MKLDILAIGVHPDDIELSCSGTLLKQIAMGYKVGLLDLTQGELGTRGSAELRLQEAEKARAIMGALVRENIGIPDGLFTYCPENILPIVEVIRKYKPEIVLANALSDRHPDHGRAAKLTSDACFLAGLRKIETMREGKPQTAWRPNAVYHYIQDHHLDPDFVVDISDFFDGKMAVIKAFKSQFYDPDSKEPASPISGKDFFDFIESKAKVYGRTIKVTYGEGFQVARPIGVPDIMNLR